MDKDKLKIPEDNSEVNPDNNNQEQEPKPGSKEYDAAMRKKLTDRYESAGKGDNDNRDDFSSDMPEGGQEKFFNKETGEYDWASHVKELEWKLGQKAGDDKDTLEGGSSEDDPEGGDPDAPSGEDILARSGLDADELGQEIVETGNINAEAREKLVKAGLPETLIDSYVQMASEYKDNAVKSAYDYAGGEDAWNELSDWAQKNMADDELKGVNEMLSSENWKTAIDLLKHKRREANPTFREGRRRRGDRAGGSVGSYESREQWLADINSAEYKQSPEFRRQVTKRRMNSTFKDTY